MTNSAYNEAKPRSRALRYNESLLYVVQVNLPKRHLRVTATSDIRQLSELPIDIFNTKLPPSSGNLREAAQNHSPDGCRFGRFTCICKYKREMRVLYGPKLPHLQSINRSSIQGARSFSAPFSNPKIAFCTINMIYHQAQTAQYGSFRF